MFMEIKFLTVFWMVNLITAQQIDESISFTQDIRGFRNSYWEGNLEIKSESSFLEEGIGLQISLNNYQGLLFYLIDNSYRTLFAKLKEDIFEIGYYSFRIDHVIKQSFSISELKNNMKKDEFNMTFTLVNAGIKIQSNGKYQTAYYNEPRNPAKDLDKFRKSFHLPIPIFNNSKRASEVYIWIGNTPSTDDPKKYQNIAELLNSDNNLFGCVMFFTIKNIQLKLATSGNHVGKMISPYCKPICNSNPCLNNARCFDLWRGRFFCDCGLSKYYGKRCEIDYSVKFNGSFKIEEKHHIPLQKLKFTFKAHIYEEYGGHELLSLRSSSSEYFQLYIDTYENLHARFTIGKNMKLERFRTKIVNFEIYTLFAEINLDGILMEIYNSSSRTLIETLSINSDNLNFIVEDIIVGGSHLYIADDLKNFRGCFSNLVLSSQEKEFTLDKLERFKKFPRCENPLDSKFKQESLLTEKKTSGKNAILNETTVVYSYTAYILIAVVSSICLLIILIVVIIIKFNSRKSNKNPTFNIPEKFILEDVCYNTNDSFKTYRQNEFFQIGDLTDSAPCHIYPAPIYMTYKPAYKARSLCSSITNRSLISLPVSPTPTLATPEDG